MVRTGHNSHLQQLTDKFFPLGRKERTAWRISLILPRWTRPPTRNMYMSRFDWAVAFWVVTEHSIGQWLMLMLTPRQRALSSHGSPDNWLDCPRCTCSLGWAWQSSVTSQWAGQSHSWGSTEYYFCLESFSNYYFVVNGVSPFSYSASPWVHTFVLCVKFNNSGIKYQVSSHSREVHDTLK